MTNVVRQLKKKNSLINLYSKQNIISCLLSSFPLLSGLCVFFLVQCEALSLCLHSGVLLFTHFVLLMLMTQKINLFAVKFCIFDYLRTKQTNPVNFLWPSVCLVGVVCVSCYLFNFRFDSISRAIMSCTWLS